MMSGDEGAISSGDESGNAANENAPDKESSRTYCFGASMVALSRVKEMVEEGYFVDGEA
jgi:hypothetical protein